VGLLPVAAQPLPLEGLLQGAQLLLLDQLLPLEGLLLGPFSSSYNHFFIAYFKII